jgi:response regulator RpfG family c-di-GMP phosphodiesterase
MGRERLDEILIQQGLITDKDVKEALLHQKTHGGKFGSHLLYCRFVTEAQLVDALSSQLGHPGVVITGVKIPKNVVEMIPRNVALARKVMPFEYNRKSKVLKIACDDPTDQSLIKELSFVVSGIQIELHVAAEIAINTAIAKYYLGRDTTLDDNFLLEILEDPTKARVGPQSGEPTQAGYTDEVSSEVEELFLGNLDLMTSLLSSAARQTSNHSRQVGRYTEKLCRKLALPCADRLLIASAGYLHDLARFYYKSENIENDRRLIQMSIRLLVSLNYSPAMIEILQSMYANLDEEHETDLPIHVLGGNIITIVDQFCHAAPDYERLSLDRFDGIKKKLRDQAGRLFLQDVVEAFIEMVQVEVLGLQTGRRSLRLMLYCEDQVLKQPLEMRLKSEGFGVVSHDSVASLAELYERGKPDVLLLAVMGDAREATRLADELAFWGVKIVRTPTLLLVKSSSVPRLAGLLERGIEDIIVLEDNLDLLVGKIRRLETEARATPEGTDSTEGPSTCGSLDDTNLIDLLQSLGTSGETVRIEIESGKFPSDRLTLYMESGRLVFAELKDLNGPEAAYEGCTWLEGSWTVEPVEAGDVPPPNISMANESILMEACKLLDERSKATQPIPTS